MLLLAVLSLLLGLLFVVVGVTRRRNRSRSRSRSRSCISRIIFRSRISIRIITTIITNTTIIISGSRIRSRAMYIIIIVTTTM